MGNSYTGSLKYVGVIMVVFAVIYAIVGTMALAGIINGALPGQEKQEMIIAALGYLVALLALVCGVACIKGMMGAAKVFGMIFAALGLFSLIYQQLAHDTFSTFDCLAMCFGVVIFSLASKAKLSE